MRLKLILLVLLVSPAFVACGPAKREIGESTTATATHMTTVSATATPLPALNLLGPLPKNGALFEEPQGARAFVVDVATGDIYAIAGDERNGPHDIHWQDDDSLFVSVGQQRYALSLDGKVSPAAVTPTPGLLLTPSVKGARVLAAPSAPVPCRRLTAPGPRRQSAMIQSTLRSPRRQALRSSVSTMPTYPPGHPRSRCWPSLATSASVSTSFSSTRSHRN